MIARFAVTLFSSAALLFACQPMVARMIAPLLGGAPVVWILCSLFFQVLVLAGYLYAHVASVKLSPRVQVIVQAGMLAVALAAMPVVIDEQVLATLTGKSRSFGLLVALLYAVGAPFFVLSTTAPLLQRWYASSTEDDPYHLYAASNAGSLLALLGYPFVVEPFLTLHGQSRAMQVTFAGYAVLVLVCGVTVLRRKPAPVGPLATAAQGGEGDGAVVPDAAEPGGGPWRDRLVWIGLAAAPSSLLLGATQFVTTDIASVPLLWVIPLALYLASFVLAFAKRQVLPVGLATRLFAFLAAGVTLAKVGEIHGPTWLVLLLHFGLLALASVLCHRALALRRPHPSRLTEFYLSLSVGGVLGGVFNGLVAPVVFNDIYEYPIAIALVTAATVAFEPDAFARANLRAYARDAAWGVGFFLVTWILSRIAARVGGDPLLNLGWVYVLPVLVAFAFRRSRPVRYGLGLGGILIAGMVSGTFVGDLVHKERGFFGVLKVRKDMTGRFLVLQSGSTIHGAEPLDRTKAPARVTYYHRSGPCGDVLEARDGASPRSVGVIGLGVGALTAYAAPGDRWTYFEIDPLDVAIAKRYFGYLSGVPAGATVDIELGDARLLLRDGAAARFDVLVLDAFTSDAIPVHLVTREALAVYRRALRPGGILLAHISNRHLDLAPVFARLAADQGLAAAHRNDVTISDDDEQTLKSRSHWVLFAEEQASIDAVLPPASAWSALVARPDGRVWTDDYANLLGAMRLR